MLINFTDMITSNDSIQFILILVLFSKIYNFKHGFLIRVNIIIRK